MRSPGTPWTADEIRRAATWRAKGWAAKRIGAVLGRTKRAVQQMFDRRASAEGRRVLAERLRFLERAKRQRALDLMASGVEAREIAYRAGAPLAEVQGWIEPFLGAQARRRAA